MTVKKKRCALEMTVGSFLPFVQCFLTSSLSLQFCFTSSIPWATHKNFYELYIHSHTFFEIYFCRHLLDSSREASDNVLICTSLYGSLFNLIEQNKWSSIWGLCVSIGAAGVAHNEASLQLIIKSKARAWDLFSQILNVT